MATMIMRPGSGISLVHDAAVPALPLSAATDQIKYKAMIDLAAELYDWPMLLLAVDKLIEGQSEVVAWWDAGPGTRLRAGTEMKADRHSSLTMEEAERQLGIKQWQVSRWRIALGTKPGDKAKYRDRLVEAARKKAGLKDDDPSATRGQPERDGPDFWPTPESLILAAREHMVPMLSPGSIWECAAGDGRLGRGIGAEFMTDKYPQDDSEPLDFLTDDPPAGNLIAFTNPPFNVFDEFLSRGLYLLDHQAIGGLVLLLRHDHFMASGKVEALNRAVLEIHCSWRPTWIPDTVGNPRWAFAWVYWGNDDRRPSLYLKEPAA